MSFQGTLSNADVFKKIVFAVGDLVENGNLECTADGISLQAMDGGHVSLVSLFLSSHSFDNFACSNDISLGINFTALSKVLKCSKPKDALTFEAAQNTYVSNLSSHSIFTDH